MLGRIPNPLENPLTTYNTAQSENDGVLREILQKVFLMPYYGKVWKMPNENKIFNAVEFTKEDRKSEEKNLIFGYDFHEEVKNGVVEKFKQCYRVYRGKS